MFVEHSSGQNPLEAMGGLITQSREGTFRAAGPFAYPILAGTVGATCLVLAMSLWHWHRMTSIVGVAAGAAIAFITSCSTAMTAIAAPSTNRIADRTLHIHHDKKGEAHPSGAARRGTEDRHRHDAPLDAHEDPGQHRSTPI